MLAAALVAAVAGFLVADDVVLLLGTVTGPLFSRDEVAAWAVEVAGLVVVVDVLL